jgi:antitoxin (DNA-binding transcriptional repressor) of toxin-antitoxin stability system
MKFLSVQDLTSKSTDVWKGLAAEREIVVTSNGRPVAILSAVTEETFEETLSAIRRARAVVAVSEIHWRSIQQGTDNLTSEEIDAEIIAARRARREAGKVQQ